MIVYVISLFMIFFFNDTATTEIYTYGHTLSLHDALPIYDVRAGGTISARSLPNPTNPQAPSILTGVRVDGGGANLKPTMITSQDITFEYYPSSSSFIYIDLFAKQIKDHPQFYSFIADNLPIPAIAVDDDGVNPPVETEDRKSVV